MNILKESRRERPTISLIFLDWSVRESFHVLHYLQNQTVPRDEYEVIVVEYYSRRSEAIRPFEHIVDTWVLLEMPEDVYYHKHLMYNVGIVLSRGAIVAIGDSDAMVTERFLERIIRQFVEGRDVVYHMDQFRNARQDLYPFSYPSFATVTGPGCINFAGGATAGIRDTTDPLHTRNYGACMCARRRDLIEIGGADEHIDYLGHVCGPYEMTFRLVNRGNAEVWEEKEFTYHTWHPGQAGAGNYEGPHDGAQISTLALEALSSGRIRPLVENAAIALLRTGRAPSASEVRDNLIDPAYLRMWRQDAVTGGHVPRTIPGKAVPLGTYKGYRLTQTDALFRAFGPSARAPDADGAPPAELAFEALSLEELQHLIDAAVPLALSWARLLARLPVLVLSLLQVWTRRIRRLVIGTEGAPIPTLGQILLASCEAGNVTGDIAIAADGVGKSLAPSQPLVILLGSSHSAVYLRLLRCLKVVPQHEIQVIKTANDLRSRLGELKRSGWTGRIIMPSALFARFHTAIIEGAEAPWTIVI